MKPLIFAFRFTIVIFCSLLLGCEKNHKRKQVAATISPDDRKLIENKNSYGGLLRFGKMVVNNPSIDEPLIEIFIPVRNVSGVVQCLDYFTPIEYSTALGTKIGQGEVATLAPQFGRIGSESLPCLLPGETGYLWDYPVLDLSELSSYKIALNPKESISSMEFQSCTKNLKVTFEKSVNEPVKFTLRNEGRDPLVLDSNVWFLCFANDGFPMKVSSISFHKKRMTPPDLLRSGSGLCEFTFFRSNIGGLFS